MNLEKQLVSLTQYLKPDADRSLTSRKPELGKNQRKFQTSTTETADEKRIKRRER